MHPTFSFRIRAVALASSLFSVAFSGCSVALEEGEGRSSTALESVKSLASFGIPVNNGNQPLPGTWAQVKESGLRLTQAEHICPWAVRPVIYAFTDGVVYADAAETNLNVFDHAVVRSHGCYVPPLNGKAVQREFQEPLNPNNTYAGSSRSYAAGSLASFGIAVDNRSHVRDGRFAAIMGSALRLSQKDHGCSWATRPLIYVFTDGIAYATVDGNDFNVFSRDMARSKGCFVPDVAFSSTASRVCVTADPSTTGRPGGIGLTGLPSKYWPNGATLRVRFLNGSPTLQGRVMAFAKEWTSYANLRMVQVDAEPSDIRVRLADATNSDPPRSNSFLGTDALTVPATQQTMNLGWATETASDAELKRVVLHEFGHAIGLHHEHLNPVGGIQWNKDAVYKDLMNPPNKWNKADVDDNLFEPLSKTQTNFTAFDPLSIMVYAISSKWTLDGYSVPETDALSDTDKKVVALYYPRQTLSEIDANCINPFDSSDAAVRGSGPYSVVNPACRGAMRKWVRDNGVGTAVIAQGFKPKTVGVGAITPDVTVTANYADLTALRGDCNRQDDWSVGSLNACVTAVQLYCQQRTGYYAGMAQSYDRATGQVEIACMSATFVNVTPTDVAARDSACDVRNAGPFGFHSSACLGVARDVCSEGGKNPNRVGILTSVAGDSVQMACVQANWFGEVRVTP